MWTNISTKSQTQSQDMDTAIKTLNSLLSRTDIGFFNCVARKKEISAIQAVADKMRAQYQHIAILGIGGSALGSLAVFEALLPQWLEEKKILFFDNVDSSSFYRKLHGIQNPKNTLWVIISKSGSTIETLTQAECIDAYLKTSWDTTIAENCVVITEKKSSDLYDWAKSNSIDILEVPFDVGGRFSVLTAVGLFPMAFAGLSIDRILLGAEHALQQKEFLQKLLAEYIHSLHSQAQAAYFFSYCDDLRHFGLWLEQLWAESLGKKQMVQGSLAPAVAIPISCRGATDQHSVLQQVAHGQQKKMATFFRIGSAEGSSHTLKSAMFQSTQTLLGQSIGALLKAEAIATEQALKEENVHTVCLYTEKLNEESLGFLFMTYKILVASLGLSLGIDPFDQPGVERGKVLARALLKAK